MDLAAYNAAKSIIESVESNIRADLAAYNAAILDKPRQPLRVHIHATGHSRW